MYRLADEKINEGLSRGARMLLGIFASIFGGVFLLWMSNKEFEWLSLVPAAVCFVIAMACFTWGRVRQFFGSVIGLVLVITGVYYLGSELLGEGRWFSSRSDPSVFNAILFNLVFSLPGGVYVWRTGFGFRKPPEPVDTIATARDAFAEIARRFPGIDMVEGSDEHVELEFNLPVQKGVSIPVWLCLQNVDELHFAVGNFWASWFPCSDPEVVSAYIEAVTGYLRGNYRILEHHRGTRCVKAELQKLELKGWETVSVSVSGWPIPWSGKTFREVRNTM